MALGISPEAIVEKGNYRLLVKANHWQRIPLSDVATVQNGFAFKSEFFDRERGLPLIRIRDITKSETEHKFNGAYDASFVVRNGNILIGMDGDFTVARWQGEDALLNQRVCRIRVKSDGYDEKFLLIVLQPYLNAIHAETSSVTVKHLSSRTIGEIPLPHRRQNRNPVLRNGQRYRIPENRPRATQNLPSGLAQTRLRRKAHHRVARTKQRQAGNSPTVTHECKPEYWRPIKSAIIVDSISGRGCFDSRTFQRAVRKGPKRRIPSP